MYKRILVPIDLAHGDVGEEILKKAQTLADTDATLLALTITPEVPSFLAPYLSGDVPQEAVDVAENELRKLVARVGVTCETRAAHGVPHVRILDIMKSWEPDLVIVGSHRPNISDYLIGSTAARVVRHATCSVLVDR